MTDTLESLDEFTESAELEERDEVGNLITELEDDSDIEIRIYQLTANTRKAAYLFGVAPHDYSMTDILERCQRDYGTGDYRVDVRVDGRWRIKKPFSVRAVDTPAPAPVQNNNDIVALIAAMNESSNKLAEQGRQQSQQFMQLMMENQRHASESQNNILLKMMEIQAANKPDNSQTDILSVLTLAEKMFNKPDNPMDNFLKGVDFGRDSSSEDPLAAAVKHLGAPLVEMTKQINPELKTDAAKPTKPPLPAPANPTPPTEQKGDQPTMVIRMIMAKYKPQIETLLMVAAQQLPVDTYCDMILDIVEANRIEPTRMLALLENDAYYQKVFELEPRATPHKAWFDQLRAALLECLAPDPSDDVPESPADADLPAPENADAV